MAVESGYREFPPLIHDAKLRKIFESTKYFQRIICRKLKKYVVSFIHWFKAFFPSNGSDVSIKQKQPFRPTKDIKKCALTRFLTRIINGKWKKNRIFATDKFVKSLDMNIFSFFKKKGESGLTYNRLEAWLDDVMQMTIPNEVVAFCFNLYEDANKSWTLELIGASSFDTTDNDWACDEVFTTRDNPLTWYDDKEWQDVLTVTIKMLKDYLEKGKYAKELKERQGLAVGFVDGDLTLL